ncbi:MAG: HD domain-containing protein [Candidatus Parcubacteria bacterium]|nr:HD domain-containing protein [Candidatus Parcubacteria bacterium]
MDINKNITNRELFLKKFSPYLSAFGMERIYDAYRFAKYAHKEQYRTDGCRYVEHPRAMVKILADELGIVNDWKLIVTALLHDVWEDTWLLTPSLTKKIFGGDIALWLSFLTREKEHSKEEFPRYIGKISESGIWQVVLIKVCDRLHNLRTLKNLDIDRQKRYLHETETYFYDLAKVLIQLAPKRLSKKMVLLEQALIFEINTLKIARS